MTNQKNFEDEILHEAFVKKWLEAKEKSQTQIWIAEELGLSRKRVSQRAAYMRMRGIKLPNLSTHPNMLDPKMIEDLNELIEAQNQKNH